MSKLWVKIDYVVAKTVLKGVRNWLDKMEDLLDKAVLENGRGDKNGEHY